LLTAIFTAACGFFRGRLFQPAIPYDIHRQSFGRPFQAIESTECTAANDEPEHVLSLLER
jgi:hypothetical protein